MIRALTKRARVLTAVAFVTYKEWAAYRSHMLLSLLVGPAFFLAQVFIWQAVYTNRETLAGFTRQEMLYYYGTVTLVGYVTMDFADWNLQMLVRTGRFLTFALRPVSHRTFALGQKIGHRTLGVTFELVPVWLVFAFVFGVVLLPARPAWALVSIALGFLMMFFVNYSVGLAAFWLTRTDGLRLLFRFFRDVLAGAFIPLSFFPGPVQKALFVLPFQFITYVPVRVFIGRYELAGVSLSVPQIVGLQLLAVVVMAELSRRLSRVAMARFTAVGT